MVDKEKKRHIICRLNAPIAQLDRAPGYELGGREFESLWARHIHTITNSDSNYKSPYTIKKYLRKIFS
jgi:hypothetical protein